MAGLESVRQTIAEHTITSPVGVEVMREVRGDYRGQGVQTTSESSKLSDAAEEIGMSVAHRADRKTLGQREVRQGQGTMLNAIARIADYYDKLPNMPREDKLRSLVEQLSTFADLLERGGKGGGSAPTKEDILAALQNFDPDVTHQFAALEIAREHFETAGAPPELLALLDEARGEFEKTDVARDVRAGFAAAKIADRMSQTLETDPGAVRDTYRTMLRESGNIGQIFDALAKLDLSKKFTEVLDTFMSIAGQDLSSTGPSSDPTFLHGLMTELGKLKKIKTVFEETHTLVQQTERPLPRSQRGLGDATDITSRLLNFASRMAASLQDARGLLGGYSQASPELQVVFANGLKGLHAMLPDDMMPSIQARQQQVATLMSLLGHLVDAEEEAYADGGTGKPSGQRDPGEGGSDGRS